jgi:hypothetical protein
MSGHVSNSWYTTYSQSRRGHAGGDNHKSTVSKPKVRRISTRVLERPLMTVQLCSEADENEPAICLITTWPNSTTLTHHPSPCQVIAAKGI